ncbi:MAG TPA: erythromycin esterase family protein [Chryseolinea sp.]|nr:erythromycin esterase family protein [Chryseolinea sp.]
MKKLHLALLAALAFCALACKDDEEPVDPVTASLVETLNEHLVPLSTEPTLWTNEELRFLDAVSDHSIVGLGEATHGSAEFFKAKHRILKYLVENHGFKIFAIEADFGESILINEAVLNGDKNRIESLMKEKMHFWTWRTNEVRDLLYWMCDYNVGKAEGEKVQYWGVDCQFNTYHPDMVKEHIQDASVSFTSFANAILSEASAESNSRFSNYSKETFDTYIEKLNALKDSLTKYKVDIVAVGSEKQYQLTLQLVEEIREVSEVMYYSGKTNGTKNYRDEYMAKNTAWLHNYFDGAKIVLWAHNFHVSDYLSAGSMGHHLKVDFPDDYTALGFLFSKGFFTAVTQSGDQFQGLNRQSLNDDPTLGSLNDVMYRAKADVFTVDISDLQSNDAWSQAFLGGIKYFQMGALYNNRPADYYAPFNARYFDRLIYFEETTASVPVQ